MATAATNRMKGVFRATEQVKVAVQYAMATADVINVTEKDT